MIMGLSQRITSEDVQLYYQIALLGQKDLELAPDSRMGFEMVMLRMLAFKPVSSKSKQVDTKPISHDSPAASSQSAKPAEPITPQAHPAEKNTSPFSGSRSNNPNWADMISLMKLESLTRELANNCVLDAIDDETCRLQLDASHQQLLTPSREKRLQQALQDYRGAPTRLSITIVQAELETPSAQMAKEKENRQQAAIDAINSDANVEALKEYFDARILPGTIEPV